MQLDLGYFEDFKSADTLLVSGSPAEIERLAETVESFCASTASTLLLPTRGNRIAGAELHLTKGRGSGNGCYALLVTPDDAPAIAGKLRAVAMGAPAHQYFELVGSETQLMVSSGEYPSEWWRAQA